MWKIPRKIVNHLMTEALRRAPLECVGVLSGHGREVTGWHPLPNILQDSRRFLADPAEQIRLFRQLREEGREVVASYHSHPSGAAWPSQEDMAQSGPSDRLMLILALGVAGRLELHGFLLHAGRVEVQEIQVVEES